ncbi:hypothetical protein GAYE_SCF03G2387 [Galdieria yellowstonensis]|uniref:Translation initiation factor IF-2 n=1 Tax=Galdieria yellowstonensis TaxID=3028027 RepID=A0AAV9IBA2_9RHOD|nr:hypothetical protein GAYE_SCF03G2387 [Galdieria yellowstonensis]
MEEDWEPTNTQTAIFGKKKKKKKEKTAVQQETSNVGYSIETEEVDSLNEGAKENNVKPGRDFQQETDTKHKKKKGNAYTESFTEDFVERPSKNKSAFQQLHFIQSEDVEEEEEEQLIPTTQQPNNSLLSKFAALNTEDGTTEELGSEVDDMDETHSSSKSQQTASNRKKQSSTSNAKSQKGKKDKKSTRTAKEEEEIDAILAQLEKPNSPKKNVDKKENEKSKAATTASTEKAAKDDTIKAEEKLEEKKNAEVVGTVSDEKVGEAAAAAGGGGLTANQKKKLKKKAAKERAKESREESIGSNEALNDSQGGSKKTSKGDKEKKKESAALRKMKEALYAKRLEEERIRREQEEAERRAEEERRREEEEERKREELRRQKKEMEKEKRRKLKQEGKLLSRAERQKRERAAQFREQAIASGVIPAFQESTSQTHKKTTSRKQKRSNRTTEDQKEHPDETNETYPTTESNQSVGLEPEQGNGLESAQSDAFGTSWDSEDWDSKAEQLKKTNLEVDELFITAGNTTLKTNEERNWNSHVAPTKESAKAQAEEDTNDSSSSSSYDSEEERVQQMEKSLEKRRELTHRLRQERYERAYKGRNPNNLRAPVICILGHVDTGKTKILDKIRKTSVQEGEAGGITQQIGATYFPIDRVKEQVDKVGVESVKYQIPALLIIDTPGHESFTNLRSRGSSLCDIAILVVDIMHGIEPQTMESIELLKQRKTPFIVALNKVDRLFGWKEIEMSPIRQSLEKQANHVQEEFKQRVLSTQVAFAELGFNADLYWQVADPRKYVSLVPTSAVTGEGIPDLLMLLVQFSQRMLIDRIMFMPFLTCTVLEVKVIEGLGTTIDVILTNGELHEGDTIVVCGLEGPIVTTIRALLTPHPMKEMRVKGQYLHHKVIQAAQGVKIAADGLDKAVAGTQLLVAAEGEDLEVLKEDVMSDLSSTLSSVDKSGVGVYVQASTLGSLEALLEFLRTSKIPVSGINIGPVHKKDVMRASAMLEHRKEYATILAFDVKVEKEAKELAEEYGVRIFAADIIYHLFDQFTAYMEQIRKARKEEASSDVVFPCVLRIVPNCIFNKKDPIIIGVQVVEGIARVGTPLVVRNGTTFLDIGRIQSIEQNKKPVTVARKGDSVAVKISSRQTETIMYGRHFDEKNDIYSKLSRKAIDLLKENFRDELSVEDWQLVVKLKKMLNIL